MQVGFGSDIGLVLMYGTEVSGRRRLFKSLDHQVGQGADGRCGSLPRMSTPAAALLGIERTD